MTSTVPAYLVSSKLTEPNPFKTAKTFQNYLRELSQRILGQDPEQGIFDSEKICRSKKLDYSPDFRNKTSP